jgi:serine O-acetyltransferase
MTCRKLILSDLGRLSKSPNMFTLIRYLITNASFKITFWFRIGTYLKVKIDNTSKVIKLLYAIIYLVVFVIHKHNQYLTGISIPLGTRVGKGLLFPHFSGIVINSNAIIGDNCTIFQGVTIGNKRNVGDPIIGNNCVLTAGAKIIGNIRIGNNVVVGANAVVVENVPDNAIVGGIPAKILNMNGEKMCKLYI